jgi:hypothetical protein
LLPLRDQDLGPHNVDARHHFGDRVLTWIRGFTSMKNHSPIGVNEELDRACIVITGGLGQADGCVG